MTGNDTIYALSSGGGRSAIAVLRISGGQTSDILTDITGGLPLPRQLAVRQIRDHASAEVLDKAMVVWLPAPKSFTGEDCAELHLHGSPAVISAVSELLSRRHGVRPAEAGEFTRRAFLSGKMDLVEVEGLGDLLVARTAWQRRQAFRQMSGVASSVFEDWREQLLLIRADIEASVDFADEPGVAEAASSQIDFRIRALCEGIELALVQSNVSEVIREGVRIVLAGLPNTGKSSLLNAVARREAAIVSDIPGTTRDAIEVLIDINGIPAILTDTAGLRHGPIDEVEAEGIRRSHRHISGADIVIWIWADDVAGSETPGVGVQPDLAVRNKVDVSDGAKSPRCNVLEVSTRTGNGLAEFLSALSSLIRDRYGNGESALIVSARQKQVTLQTIRHLNEALAKGPGVFELKAEEIRKASYEIGRLTGRIDVEEWLGAIFSRFCIGK